ncbi:MAG: hypothetical protein IPL61_22810 [Myxococcales bacterium]|nr:hypothetical protein [Myxococcales bacterium]
MELRPLIVKVVQDSCAEDAWSTEAIDCMSRSSFDLSGLVPQQTLAERFGGCGRFLTEPQDQGMGARFGAEIDKRMNSEGTPPEPEPEPAAAAAAAAAATVAVTSSGREPSPPACRPSDRPPEARDEGTARRPRVG